MEPYQYELIEFLIEQKALLFGDFTLKSGRKSPYFFNAGQFNTAASLAKLGQFYAKAIINEGIEYDILFGPAYKGIPIVSSVAIALYEKYQQDVPFCFNRKEQKAYGEGGYIIGSPLQGRVLLVDDVISAGTTFRETAELIATFPTQLIGIITALDREEKGSGDLTAMKEIETRYNVKALSIVKLRHIIEYLRHHPQHHEALETILSYQEKYGTS
ncbi:MAG: orotate phosphoribosyltransferase [Gammaproteobacteria bacterium]|nr:orotate phosphoribosyltransferase [Gammaproteobacteria bacterium]